MLDYRIDNAHQFIGKELAVSDWLRIDQPMVTTFANTTLDPDWMHVDVARSRRESPYGGTIVQGFLMLSLVIHFGHVLGTQPKDTAYGLNYGLDKVRFLAPVLVGARVRNHVVLADFRERSPGRYLQRTTNTLEVEGSDKPGMVADWLVLWFRDLDS
ncbi:MAG: MaoC family dehydratase [Alphaproteobacteria bacterium]